MRNLDKYFDELLNGLNPCGLIRDLDEKYEDCYECPFDTNSLCSCNNEKFKEWLLEEIREPIKCTIQEKHILESIHDNFKYIARDRCGTLCVFEIKPHKANLTWTSSSWYVLTVFNHLFHFIKWEDNEPYEIKDILKNCEVVENE